MTRSLTLLLVLLLSSVIPGEPPETAAVESVGLSSPGASVDNAVSDSEAVEARRGGRATRLAVGAP